MFNKLFEEVFDLDDEERMDILTRVINAIEKDGYVIVDEDALDFVGDANLRAADKAIYEGDVQEAMYFLEEDGVEFREV